MSSSSDAYLAERVCPRCGVALPSEAVACPRCAASSPGARFAAAPVTPARGKWNDQPIPMLAMLFLGFGPFAIPWLWRGKAFNAPAKAVLSVAVTIYFAGLCGLVWWSISTLLAVLRGG